MKEELFPTYMDLKYQKFSRIFESEQIKDLDPNQIYEAEMAYDAIVEKLKNGEDIDEGFLSGLVGGGIGALAGPMIGKALCSVLGIKEDGVLGKLLTSKLVLGAMGYALAK
jgi:hypothetical protein